MKDYEEFVEFRRSQLKKTKDIDEEANPKSPSLICFYGRPILSPPLSGPQRGEMCRLKEAALKAAENRKHKDDPRMSYVQTILHRKMSTLEELLKESNIDTQASPNDSISGSLSESSFTHIYTLDNYQKIEVKDNLKDSPKNVPAPKCLVEIHTQTDDEDSKLPHRMSLQALLKKSQQYRVRQHMLRSQAKSAQVQDRAQDQPKSEEQSLFDKENDEQLTKGTEPKKRQERSDSHWSILDQAQKRSYKTDRKTDNIYDSHLRIDYQAQDYSINPCSESLHSIKINNWVSTSGPRNVSSLVPIWAEKRSNSRECSAKTSPTTFNGVKKYHNVPALKVCRSPFLRKIKSPSVPFDKNSKKGAVINTSIKNYKIESNSGTLALNVVESDLPSVSAKSSQHINQLESNLSGPKVLISDLVSTLTENVDTISSQSESQTPISQNNSVCSLGDVYLSQKSQSPDNDKTSLMETEIAAVNSQQLVTPMITSREKDHTRLINTKSTRRPAAAQCTLSRAQRMHIPDVFRTCLPEATTHNVPVLSDVSNHRVKINSDVGIDSHSSSLNQSCDTPSELWLHSVYSSQKREEKQMTPESGGEGQGAGSKGKRRLQMTEVEKRASRPSSNTLKAAAVWHENLDSVMEKREQLKQLHSDQIRVLQDEHRRQQEQLLQELAARCILLHGMSLPCSMSTSLGDRVTFATLSQPSTVSHLEHYRHLLVAIAKGFLTRRLLRTEKVALLVRTARDTQQFLLAFQKQSPVKGLRPKEDVLLQERAKRQLCNARYKIHDIFLRLSSSERMQLISTDRELVREREFKRQWSGSGGQQRGKNALSAATQKSLERNKSLMLKKKTVEKHSRAGMRTRHMPGFSGPYSPYLQRFKSTYTSRVR